MSEDILAPVLEVDNLHKWFDVSKPPLQRLIERLPRQTLKAVDGVSFRIERGTTFALVGESGCGKSTVAQAVAGLHKPTRGAILFEGIDRDLPRPDGSRPELQMIFQDPFASLNPRWRVRDIIAEPLRVHRLTRSRAETRAAVAELLEQVRLSPADGEKYPHEFSGGQRQRISIARALANKPKFLVCDEPTSALDVSVQAQILNLMKRLQRELGLTYLLISHNLAVIYHMADELGVMYLGRLVETGPAREIFNRPRHPYTQLLLDTIPDISLDRPHRTFLKGEVPSPIAPPPGCTFHPRCPHANDRCRTEPPRLESFGGVKVACHAVGEGRIVPAVREWRPAARRTPVRRVSPVARPA
ncbi:ABC transporter ATP-binding protein [Acuticoccus mangrovi]|uniref:ATP-binding cassette domain-containing protein n=1 Tax=Acuticoccus mangrovi TaxID=2796142 RepID=A0A934MP59_9HYPH|nr:oligopeptide/dipeptide ABC transporter ATP-binding protein [Acuticoccus mangrovi]MBJ3778799.1 ATP-binding cassette domain-containing protein [Acuticoccus mangrovi]